MFDLDAQRRGWRDALLREDALGPDEVDELEDHLLSELETLKAVGLSEEEAFWVAAKRVGDGDVLALEFGKVNRRAVWSKRAQWMLAGYLTAVLLTALFSALSNGAALLVASLSHSASFTALVYISANVLLVVFTLFLAVTSVKQELGGWKRLRGPFERAQQNIFLSAVAVTLTMLFLRLLGVAGYRLLDRALTYEVVRGWGYERSEYVHFLAYTDGFRMFGLVLLPAAVVMAMWQLRRAREKVRTSEPNSTIARPGT